jgi:hypothetical protein
MAHAADMLKALLRQGSAEAAAVLQHALPHAAGDELLPICRALCRTGQPRAIAAALAHLHRLGERGVEQLRTPVAGLDEAVAILRRSGRPQPLLNALEAIEHCGNAALVRHASGMLTSREVSVRSRAADVLLSLTVSCLGERGRRRTDAIAHERIDAAVCDALESHHQHRMDQCLVAAAIASVRPGRRLAAILDEEGHSALFALRCVARRTDLPLVRRNMLNWLAVEALGRSIVQRLHALSGAQQIADFLEGAHLALNPQRRRTLRRMPRPARWLPDRTIVRAMPAESQARLVDALGWPGVPASRRAAGLRDMRAASSPLARVKAAFALTGQVSDEARQELEHFTRDRDAAVAHFAMEQVLAAQTDPGVAVLRRAVRAGHTAVSQSARAQLASLKTAEFLDHWLALTPLERHIAAHRLMASDPTALADGLGERVTIGRHDSRLAAIALARRLRLCSALQNQLATAAACTDAKVASAAVAAIGDVRELTRTDALRAALRHSDARVRANAVEALYAAGDHGLAAIAEPFAATRENRVRANTVLGLIRTERPRGLDHLQRMLLDIDPMHRVSAIWAARRGRAVELRSQLQRLATDDAALEIRTRAAAARRLLGETIASTAREEAAAC